MTKNELIENYTLEELADKCLDLENQLHRSEVTINQLDDIMYKLFGVRHNVTKKPDEFEKILKEKLDGTKTIENVLPRQPIEVAEMLINADEEEELFGGKMYRILEVNDLRQIAEHLLIYCDYNEDRDNED